MQLFLIRHGQSTNNVTMVDDPNVREVDPPLTELGQRQAQAVAQYLAGGQNIDRIVNRQISYAADEPGFGITHLYCSPMLRALQTTRPIAAALGLKPNVWIEIHEHGGMYMEYTDERGIVGFPGRNRAEMLADFPDYVIPDAVSEGGWWNPQHGMETVAAAQGRALLVAAALRERATSQDKVAIVTHGTFLDHLLKALTGALPSDNYFHLHYNTGVTRIDFWEQRVAIRYINRVMHLTPELVSV